MRIQIYIGGPVMTNAYLISTNDITILIDAPYGVNKWLKELGIDKIDALLLTHQHFDHTQEANLFGKSSNWNNNIWSWNKENIELTLVKHFQDMIQNIKFDLFKTNKEIEKLDSYKKNNNILINNTEIKILHIPGHSPDSICFYFEKENIIFGGDVLFQGSIGRVDFPLCDGDLLIDGIRTKLLNLPTETIIYPGHGGKTTIGDEKSSNPFI